MLSLLSRFLSLPAGDKIRLLVATMAHLCLPTVLSVGHFDRTRTRLLWLSNFFESFISDTPTPTRIVWAVEVTDRTLPGSRTCLVRSMTAEALLRLYDYHPHHRIGVCKTADQDMEAHSWLEYDSKILIGKLENLSDYTPLKAIDR